VKQSGNENLSMPFSIIFECLLGMLFASYGVTLVSGDFKEILAAPTHHPLYFPLSTFA
jgi:hypothetical protein